MLLAACGGEPDGGLLEIHAGLDPAVADELADYRVLRVGIQGGGVDELREVERTTPPPDVFVVRSPVSVPSAASELVVTVRIQALRFTAEGEQVEACAQQDDVKVIDDAVNVIEVTLMPGDCS